MTSVTARRVPFVVVHGVLSGGLVHVLGLVVVLGVLLQRAALPLDGRTELSDIFPRRVDVTRAAARRSTSVAAAWRL